MQTAFWRCFLAEDRVYSERDRKREWTDIMQHLGCGGSGCCKFTSCHYHGVDVTSHWAGRGRHNKCKHLQGKVDYSKHARLARAWASTTLAVIGVGAGGDRGDRSPHFQDWGDNPPLFFRRVCNFELSVTAPPAARAMQGLSNRHALCVESLSLIYAEGHTYMHTHTL